MTEHEIEEIRRKIAAGHEILLPVHELRTGTGDQEGDLIVEGYATTFDQRYELYRSDYYIIEEQIDSRAFDNADMSDVIFQYDHTGRVFARLSNKTLQLKADKKGLHMRANLRGVSGGAEMYSDIKNGYITRMSMRFTVAKDTYTEERDHDTGVTTVVRTVTAVRKLYDVSAVSIPANDATDISARSYDGVIRKIMQERQKKALDTINLRLRLMEV